MPAPPSYLRPVLVAVQRDEQTVACVLTMPRVDLDAQMLRGQLTSAPGREETLAIALADVRAATPFNGELTELYARNTAWQAGHAQPAPAAAPAAAPAPVIASPQAGRRYHIIARDSGTAQHVHVHALHGAFAIVVAEDGPGAQVMLRVDAHTWRAA